MVTLTWHYDFNRMNVLDPLPDLNIYTGIGKDWNLGFGYTFPVYFTHTSIVKYFQSADNDYFASWMNLNQIIGSNNNPMFEIGQSYYQNGASSSQEISVGVGFGSGISEPLLMALNPSRAFSGKFRFLPFAKYHARVNDVNLSLSYYHGLTTAALESLDRMYSNWNDTVLFVEPDEFDSIVVYDSTMWINGRFAPVAGMFMDNGDTVLLGFRFRDMLIPIMWTDPVQQLFRYNNSDRYEISSDTGFVSVNIESLRADLSAGKPVAIMRFSEKLPIVLEQRRRKVRFWDDLSIGFGISGVDSSKK